MRFLYNIRVRIQKKFGERNYIHLLINPCASWRKSSVSVLSEILRRQRIMNNGAASPLKFLTELSY